MGRWSSAAPKLVSAEAARTEMDRILRIKREALEDTGADLSRKWTEALRKHPNAPPLRPIQGVALEVASRAAAPKGMIGNVTVGGGKTLIFALIPQVTQVERPVLLLEPSLVEPAQREWWLWAKHYWFEPPNVLPYSILSSPQGTDVLERMSPGAVLADECQALKAYTAARTRRFLRYMVANPHVRFFGLTGTLTTTSIKDYAHLAELALREETPIPLVDDLLDLWASVLSAEGEPNGRAYYHLRPLAKWAGVPEPKEDCKEAEKKAAFQNAYSERWHQTPGTVNTSGSSCDARIELRGHRFALPDALKDAMREARSGWVRPDGVEIVDGLDMARVMKQMSMGFYYIWDWPDGEEDKDYVEARRAWGRGAHGWVERHGRRGLDSPGLLDKSLAKSGTPEELLGDWNTWQKQKEKPDPPTKAVWIDYTPVLEAVAWASQHERAILWFSNNAVGEALQDFGIPTLWAGVPDPKRTPVVALSIAVYHRGFNLQAWDTQLVMEPPTSGAIWEQLIGRTHRYGQQSDVIHIDVMQHAWPLVRAMARARDRSRYIEASSKQPQKLLMANMSNFPGEVQ